MTISNLRFFTDQPNTLYDSPTISRPNLGTPELAYSYWNDHIATDPTLELRKEHLVVIPLDAKLKPVGHNIVSVGVSDQTICHPVEILRPVILAGCYRCLMIHNHPSGSVIPSPADDRVTKQLVEAAALFSIMLVDHVIVGDGYYSYREGGKL